MNNSEESNNDVQHPLAFEPKSTWLFMVSVIDHPKWEKPRSIIGEIRMLQMFEALLDPDKIVCVKDEKATRKNAQASLEQMLKRQHQQSKPDSSSSDTLLFYYGGHGLKGYFCTNEDPWYHAEIVQTIEEHFSGDQVWLFADCCFSGSLAHQFTNSKYTFNKTYLCFMSSQPHVEARDEWVMTRCIIDVMDGNNNVEKDGRTRCWTLENVVSFVADEEARTTKDCVTIYVHGNGIRPYSRFPQVSPERVPPIPQCPVEKLLCFCCSSLCCADIHRMDPSTSGWKGIDTCKVGDVVHAKWRGGKTGSDGGYAFPVWFRGQILSYNEGSKGALVELSDPFIETHKWETVVTLSNMLAETHFDWEDSDSESSSVAESNRIKASIQAHVELAKQLKYLTFSDIAPGTTVKGLWKDDVLYNATIMDKDEVNWERLKSNEPRQEFKDVAGAFVPVKWHGEDTWSVVPLSYCVAKQSMISGPQVRQEALEQGARDAVRIKTPKHAIIMGMEAMGKSVSSSTESLVGTRVLSCLCIAKEEWVPAVAATIQDIPFESLADHLHFDETGEYCTVQWDDNQLSSYATLPRKLVQPRSDAVSKACLDAHVAFARQLKYISFHSIPPGTRVQVMWWDNAFYGATVMDKNQVHWERLIRNEPLTEFQSMVGAFIPVRWDDPDPDEKKWVIVPDTYCIVESSLAVEKPIVSGREFREQARVQNERDALEIKTPRDAVMKGFLSASKKLCLSTESLIGCNELSCFTSERNEWLPAKAADVKDLQLEELVHHLVYDDQGEYSAIEWVQSDTSAPGRFSLLPKRFVRMR